MSGGAAPRSGETLATWPGRDFGVNPFMEMFCAAVERSDARLREIPVGAFLDVDPAGIDRVVIQFPQVIYSGLPTRSARLRALWRFGAALGRLRRSGARLVWIAHDLEPHDMTGWRMRLFWRATVALLSWRAHGVVTLSPGTLRMARAQAPLLRLRPGASAWHPVYPEAAMTPEARAQTRAALGIGPDERVIGCFGSLRGYKGFGDLIAAFRPVADPDARLLLGGHPARPELIGDLEAARGGDPRVRFFFERLPEERFRALVNACDLCVFPYRRYTHSGAMIYALSAGRPILAPRAPYADSLAEAVPGGWVSLYDGELEPGTLAAALAAAPRGGAPDLRAFDADAFVRTVRTVA